MSSEGCWLTFVRRRAYPYASLCDFVYNTGAGNFAGSTLLIVLNRNEYDNVPSQLRRWVIAGGKPLDGLRVRREREIALFFEGLPTPKAAAEENPGSEIDIRVGEKNRP